MNGGWAYKIRNNTVLVNGQSTLRLVPNRQMNNNLYWHNLVSFHFVTGVKNLENGLPIGNRGR